MSQKLAFFTLLAAFFLCAHPVYSIGDDFGYENWPGKDGVIRSNIEPPIAPLIKYGTSIRGPISSQSLWLNIQPEIPVSDPKVFGGSIQIYIYPSVEEAQRHLLGFINTFQSYPIIERNTDSSVGDVFFSEDATARNLRSLYFTRSNVMVLIFNVSVTYRSALEELPVIIDSMIKNAPIWKQGDSEPQLKISEEFIKAFSSPSTVNDEDTAAEAPSVFTLSQNTPNPFNPSTAIAFTLSRPERVNLTVYDALGREVAPLASGNFSAGSYTMRWDGRDGRGNAVSSGVYLYRLEAGGRTETRKMLLAR